MIKGQNIIGNSLSNDSSEKIEAINPTTGEKLDGDFYLATDEEVERAVKIASDAFDSYRNIDVNKKADFLEKIGEEIEKLGDELINRAVEETALPYQRLIGERGRTINQLKLFAKLLREGSWVEARIDLANPNRKPIPKLDIRKMLLPVGPVVVFTASNFPLAFSTAGGDTAAALAAGNPVIVKAHESHLGTNFLVSTAIKKAAEKSGMPDGVFSSLNGSGYNLGSKLVKHALVKSVAFTGSQKGGMALLKLSQERKDPIPVFAEMGSINPLVLLPNKVETEADSLATQLVGSITLGVGQFCTNPGVLIGLDNENTTELLEKLAHEIENSPSCTMLNKGIKENYNKNLSTIISQNGIELLGKATKNENSNEGVPSLAVVSGKDFIKNLELHQEVFGPFSLFVKCANKDELNDVVKSLEGQLTISFYGNNIDFDEFSPLVEIAQKKAGRIVFNGVPTGVEVCESMHHGGPFPASTDGRFTSVGTDSIKRFVQPVCFQNAPKNLLPLELQDDNPLRIWRKVEGEFTNGPIKKLTPVV